MTLPQFPDLMMMDRNVEFSVFCYCKSSFCPFLLDYNKEFSYFEMTNKSVFHLSPLDGALSVEYLSTVLSYKRQKENLILNCLSIDHVVNFIN